MNDVWIALMLLNPIHAYTEVSFGVQWDLLLCNHA